MIEVKNPELKLKPGMTANVSIIVAHCQQVLRLPNVALRFQPPPAAVIQSNSVSHATGQTHDPPANHASRKKARHEAGKCVFLLPHDQAGRARHAPGLEKVPIKTGISDGNYTEVDEGLSEGDQVVVGLAARPAPKQLASLFGGNRKK